MIEALYLILMAAGIVGALAGCACAIYEAETFRDTPLFFLLGAAVGAGCVLALAAALVAFMLLVFGVAGVFAA